MEELIENKKKIGKKPSSHSNIFNLDKFDKYDLIIIITHTI